MKSEESLEQYVLVEKLKLMKFGDKDYIRYFNSDNDDDDIQTTDEDEITKKQNVILNIPDRLLYLIVRLTNFSLVFLF